MRLVERAKKKILQYPSPSAFLPFPHDKAVFFSNIWSCVNKGIEVPLHIVGLFLLVYQKRIMFCKSWNDISWTWLPVWWLSFAKLQVEILCILSVSFLFGTNTINTFWVPTFDLGLLWSLLLTLKKWRQGDPQHDSGELLFWFSTWSFFLLPSVILWIYQ